MTTLSECYCCAEIGALDDMALGLDCCLRCESCHNECPVEDPCEKRKP